MKVIVLFIFLMGAVSLQGNDTHKMEHILDAVALKELYEAIKPAPMEYPMPYGTDNRAQYEYWQLAYRIEQKKTFEKIFTQNEKKCFTSLTEEIFASDTYTNALKRAQETAISWDQYRKIAAILAKNKLVKKGVNYQDNPSLQTFDAFLQVNHAISGEAIDWLISGSMFLYYVRQVQRENQSKNV